MPRPIYLDYHATTPIDPRVREAMLHYLESEFGNPASTLHEYGWAARDAVEKARKQVASLIGGTPPELTFTSGGTEANNLALIGLFEGLQSQGPFHLITTNVEHKSVLEAAKYLVSRGAEWTALPVDRFGKVTPSNLESALKPHTRLVSLLAANNEIGTVLEIRALAEVTLKRGILFHTDAVQAVGKLPLNVGDWGVDLMSISSHKIYGPKGAGALWVRRSSPRIPIQPLIHGGGHERGLRGGTLNVPAIVGFGAAAELLSRNLEGEIAHLSKLQSILWDRLGSMGLTMNGPQIGKSRLPNNLSLTLSGILAGDLIKAVPNLAFSTGSACTTQAVTPSHVLKAIGLTDAQAASTIRLSVGRFLDENTLKEALDGLIAALIGLKAKGPRQPEESP